MAGGWQAQLFLWCVVGGLGGFLLLIFGQYSPSPLFADGVVAPGDAQDLIRQRGAALLRTLLWWLMILAVLWVALCVVRAPETPLRSVVAWGAIEIASLAAFSALVVCLRTVGSKILDTATVVVGSGGREGNGADRQQDPWLGYPAGLYAVALAILLVGGLLYWAAYRRWLVIDLE